MGVVCVCVVYAVCSAYNDNKANIYQEEDFTGIQCLCRFITMSESKTASEHHWVPCNDAINTLRPRQNGRHFPDNIFNWILLNENVWISIDISLKFVPKGTIYNIPTLVQVMAWRLPGDKPLSELMMVRLQMHICATWPQRVNSLWPGDAIWQHRSGSGNSLLPDGTKPLPEPMWTYHK